MRDEHELIESFDGLGDKPLCPTEPFARLTATFCCTPVIRCVKFGRADLRRYELGAGDALLGVCETG